MEKKGRPATRPPELKSGYYIVVRSKGAASGIKIRRDTRRELDFAIQQYERSNKDVDYLGEVKDGRWVDGKNAGKKTR